MCYKHFITLKKKSFLCLSLGEEILSSRGEPLPQGPEPFRLILNMGRRLSTYRSEGTTFPRPKTFGQVFISAPQGPAPLQKGEDTLAPFMGLNASAWAQKKAALPLR